MSPKVKAEVASETAALQADAVKKDKINEQVMARRNAPGLMDRIRRLFGDGFAGGRNVDRNELRRLSSVHRVPAKKENK